MAAQKKEAREDARRLFEEHRTKTAPVPVERIARALGVKVQYAPLDGDLSGMAYIKDGVPIVGINSLHHPNRQRFTLAHEIAHVRLHRSHLETQVHVDKGSLQGTLRRDAVSSTGLDDREVEANAFASELLMPEELLRPALGDKTIDLEDDEAVSALAKRFRVSEAAIRYRLQVE